MGNAISTLNNVQPHYRIMALTPLLYPNNIGFTRWNFCNLLISHVCNPNKSLTKFNANNSAAVLFGSILFYATSPIEFHQWLHKHNISHAYEKIGHFLPFLYYLYLGEYKNTDYKLSISSLLYELAWSARCGNHLINKEDVYHNANKSIYWYFIWIGICYGHFFNTDNIPMSMLRTQLPLSELPQTR
jgi:hypothetical protein